MNLFDIAAIVIALTAVFGYVNHRLFRLPPTTGMLALALGASLVLIAVNALLPGWGLRHTAVVFLSRIDFYDALMHGMLCFLLFAGALHVDLECLHANRWTVLTLATVGVLISTFIIGVLTWLLFGWLGLGVPLLVCMVLGALISPTDPIAVIALLKILHAPRQLQAQIAGESLFNDGVGVVVFLAALAVAGFSGQGQPAHLALNPLSVAGFFLWQVGGGAALGLALGYLAFLALRSIDDQPLELLITLAMVMIMYTISFAVDVSGPIAVVVAGILIGTHGRQLAMSESTRAHVDAFWDMMDEILNGALFLLLGLQVLTVAWSARLLWADILVVPVVLLARGISVGVPIGVLKIGLQFQRGIIPILTWGGLRGGISIAMVLSLPKFAARDLLVSCTYLVMLFSVLVQGMTMRRLLTFYGIGQRRT